MTEQDVESTQPAPPAGDAEQSVRAAAGDEAASSDDPVAAALAELDTLADRDLAEHPAVFERVHGELQAALSAIDDA